jgi:hypothetical protein
MLADGRRCLIELSALFTWAFIAGSSLLFGQAPTNQEKIDEAIRSGERMEMLGHILVVTGVLVMVAGIPFGIYYERKKKARKQRELAERQTSDAKSSSQPRGLAETDSDHPRD